MLNSISTESSARPSQHSGDTSFGALLHSRRSPLTISINRDKPRSTETYGPPLSAVEAENPDATSEDQINTFMELSLPDPQINKFGRVVPRKDWMNGSGNLD